MEEWLYLPEAVKQHNILRYLVDLIYEDHVNNLHRHQIGSVGLRRIARIIKMLPNLLATLWEGYKNSLLLALFI